MNDREKMLAEGEGMNDSELVRKAAQDALIAARVCGINEASERHRDMHRRLTALADRLATHALVPREPSDDTLNAIHHALTGDDEGYTDRKYWEGVYRAMLTALEAK